MKITDDAYRCAQIYSDFLQQQSQLEQTTKSLINKMFFPSKDDKKLDQQNVVFFPSKDDKKLDQQNVVVFFFSQKTTKS